MKLYKMELGERVHGLNLLCGANLSDDELRITMREVDGDKPDDIYEQAKLLKSIMEINLLLIPVVMIHLQKSLNRSHYM